MLTPREQWCEAWRCARFFRAKAEGMHLFTNVGQYPGPEPFSVNVTMTITACRLLAIRLEQDAKAYCRIRVTGNAAFRCFINRAAGANHQPVFLGSRWWNAPTCNPRLTEKDIAKFFHVPVEFIQC